MTCHPKFKTRYLPAVSALFVCMLVFAAAPATAIDIITDYQYDELYRLTRVDYRVDVNDKGFRTLYTTTYSYDKNGNRVGMTRMVSAPMIDEVFPPISEGDQLTLEILGFGFQLGMLVTLNIGDGTLVAGVIDSLTPTGAEVSFDFDGEFTGDPVITVENPDTQSDTAIVPPGIIGVPSMSGRWTFWLLLALLTVAAIYYVRVRHTGGEKI